MQLIDLFERYEDRAIVLERWLNVPNIYFSFTSVDKIGINPGYNWHTPMAVYAYPLNKKLWKKIEDKGIDDALRYGTYRKYIKILRGNNVKNISEYTKEDLSSDIKKLKTLYKDYTNDLYPLESNDKPFSYNIFKGNEMGIIHTGIFDTFFRRLFLITEILADRLKDAGIGNNRCVIWNKLFRQLGYDAISDDDGSCSITNDIPFQAMFFTPKAYNYITTIPNITKRPNIIKP